jgi:hypothetical protein
MTNTHAPIDCPTLYKLTPAEVCQAATRRKVSTERYEPFEDWIHSLIAAAAIAGLLLGILGLHNSPRPQTTDQRTVIERVVPNQAKDGKF